MKYFQKYKMLKISCFLLILFTYLPIKAQTLTVSGTDWIINPTKITEAGTDYSENIESSNNQFIISGHLPGSFLNLLSGKSTKITVLYTPITWDNNLKIDIKSSGGTAIINSLCVLCTASVNNGSNYINISSLSANKLFTIDFTGLLGLANSITFSNINIQLMLSGISVTLPVENYSSTLFFTVEEL